MSKKPLQRKLHTTSGATILLALLFFLLCAVAGSVVLAAGSAASGRIAGLTDRQQTYYSVTSAARLVRDEIQGQKLSFYTKDGEETLFYKEEPDGKWKELLEAMVAQVAAEPTKASYKSAEVTITPWSDSMADEVKAEISIDNDYNLEIHLQVNDEATYACTMIIPAAVSQKAQETTIVDETGSIVPIKTTAFAWDNAVIHKAE